MSTPHDDLFGAVFRHPCHAASWARTVLPATIRATIDWHSLQPAPERLRRDLFGTGVLDGLHGVRIVGPAPGAWLALEHKSYDDPRARRQALRYALKLGELSPDGTPQRGAPTPVVFVLLHHGRQPFPERPPPGALAAAQPTMTLFVDDLRAIDEATLAGRPLLTPLARVTLLALRWLRELDADAALAALQRWAPLLRAVDQGDLPLSGPEAIRLLGWYVLRVTEIPIDALQQAFQTILQRPENDIVSTAEKLKQEGYALGFHRGAAAGQAEGRAEGQADGERRGRRTLLQSLLTKRFGPLPSWALARLEQATIAEFDQFTDRLLEASSLTAVFAPA